MKALSIRQPWAWLVIRPDITDPQERVRAYLEGQIKPVENRKWATHLRGRILIHAAAGMTRIEYLGAVGFLERIHGPELPPFEQLERGGIIGEADLVDCVTRCPSRYFVGPYGFVFQDATPLPFRPLKGALGFFEVRPEAAAAAAGPNHDLFPEFAERRFSVAPTQEPSQ